MSCDQIRSRSSLEHGGLATIVFLGRSLEHGGLAVAFVCALAALAAQSAVAHPSNWYWSAHAAQTALITDDICNDGAA